MMIVVTFLFMFSGAAKMALSNYEINEYAKVMHREVKPFSVKETNDRVASLVDAKHDFVLYVGANSEEKSMVKEWCRYNQMDMVVRVPGVGIPAGSKGSIAELVGGVPQFVIIDGAAFTAKDVGILELCMDAGIPVIFCTLPSPGFLAANNDVANMLGITKVQSNNVAIQGMHLYGGFLMGGEYVYEPDDEAEMKENDLPASVPWLVLASGAKVYMDGILVESTYKDVDVAYKPPVIWRYNTGSNYVFGVNANFMKDPTALGILTAMRCESQTVSVYPIVNAENFVLTNYPTFANENESAMRELYSRDTSAVLRDLMWPGVVSIREKSAVVPSLMMSAKLDYQAGEEPDTENVDYFMELLREQRGEAGLDLISVDSTDPVRKLDYDLDFFKKEIPDYEYQMAYIGDIDTLEARKILDDAGQGHIATLLRDYGPDQEIIIGYEEGYAVISTINQGTSHTYRDDLLMRSVQTALGYSVITEDMGRVIYPQAEEDHWQNMFKDMAGNTTEYWKPFSEFDQTTISEAGDRARMFLDLKYNVSVNKETVAIEANLVDWDDEAYFIFKAPKHKVTYVSGGSFRELEDGLYLIETNKDRATVFYKSVQDPTRRRVSSQEQAQ